MVCHLQYNMIIIVTLNVCDNEVNDMTQYYFEVCILHTINNGAEYTTTIHFKSVKSEDTKTAFNIAVAWGTDMASCYQNGELKTVRRM